MQLVTVSLTSFSLVREREQGTLEQLMVSPVGRLGLMLGKLAPYAVLAMGEMAAVLLLGRIVFDVRVAGSEATMYLWLEVPDGYESSEAFATRLLESGLVVSPGSFFGPAGEGYFRVALVPTEDECLRAAELLREAL